MMSCYLRGRQAATSFRVTKSSTRIISTGVPQGSKLSPSLFNYYIADMPRPMPPVKRICYADDITVWATGPKIPQLESMINNYLRDVSIYLKDNSLLISAPKSMVPTTTAYKWWNCQVHRPANCCHILPNRFLDGFPDPSQFAAAKLTHYASKP